MQGAQFVITLLTSEMLLSDSDLRLRLLCHEPWLLFFCDEIGS